jgi:hypothetical protein
LHEPCARLFRVDPFGVAIENARKRFALDVFHDEPVIAAFVGTKVVKVDEIGMFEIQAVADPAKFGVGSATKEHLKRHFFAAVADCEIDFAEPALAEAAFDGKAFERPLSPSVRVFHRSNPRESARLSCQWAYRQDRYSTPYSQQKRVHLSRRRNSSCDNGAGDCEIAMRFIHQLSESGSSPPNVCVSRLTTMVA